jgi:hypothetical protein
VKENKNRQTDGDGIVHFVIRKHKDLLILCERTRENKIEMQQEKVVSINAERDN